MTDYIFVYSKKGSHLSSSPWSGDLEAAKALARDGLVRRGADQVQVRADTLSGPLVWEERRSV